MLPRRRLLAQASFGVAAMVLSAGVTIRPAPHPTLSPALAPERFLRKLRHDSNHNHRHGTRHDRGGRRQSDSATMVPM